MKHNIPLVLLQTFFFLPSRSFLHLFISITVRVLDVPAPRETVLPHFPPLFHCYEGMGCTKKSLFWDFQRLYLFYAEMSKNIRKKNSDHLDEKPRPRIWDQRRFWEILVRVSCSNCSSNRDKTANSSVRYQMSRLHLNRGGLVSSPLANNQPIFMLTLHQWLFFIEVPQKC